MTTQDVTWPYSTHDEVSHLAIDDVAILRARIDQLLEERREARGRVTVLDTGLLDELGLSVQEGRLLQALVDTPSGHVCSKESLHVSISSDIEPDTAPKIVDVIVCKTRKKLEGSGIGIITHWGRGYSLDPEGRAKLKGVGA